jgi:hypothetical protein
MLHQSPEDFLRLHAAEQARFLAAAEHRRNAERRRTGRPDPVRRSPALAGLLAQARRLTSLIPLRTASVVPCEACP